MSLLQLAALNAKIARGRELVAEQQRRVRAAKSRILVHDLTHWLRNLELKRENLLRQSRLDAQRERDAGMPERPAPADAA